jgi:hypothetical protein
MREIRATKKRLRIALPIQQSLVLFFIFLYFKIAASSSKLTFFCSPETKSFKLY